MPVIPTTQQTDAWYALPFEERNRQTFDQFIGNTGQAESQPSADPTPAQPNNPGIHNDWPGLDLPNITTPGGTGSEWTPTAPAVDPSQYRLMGAAPIDLNTILGFYQQYLGRTPGVDEVYFASGHPGGAAALEDFIKNSAEAQGRAAKKVQPVPTVTPAPATRGPAPAVNTTTPYRNSSQDLLLNAALQRLSQLQMPIDHSNEDLYAKFALDRVSQLSGAPFSDKESAALLTKNMAPLTQARDTAKQQATEDLARRGIGPSSGVFQDRMKAIDQAYERGVAGVTNTLNVQGIDQVQKNAAMQLQILDSLVSMGRMSRQEAEQRSLAIVQTAGIPFDTDLRTLSALSGAAGGDNSSSLISSLLNIGGLNLKGAQIDAEQSGQDANAIGSVVGYIMAHHADFGF